MPKKAPWNSIKEDVYHNNTEFNTGNNIEKENIHSGYANKRLCEECKKLNDQGR